MIKYFYKILLIKLELTLRLVHNHMILTYTMQVKNFLTKKLVFLNLITERRFLC